MLPRELPNEKHMEVTHNGRITTLPLLVDRVTDISKQGARNIVQRLSGSIWMLLQTPEFGKGFR